MGRSECVHDAFAEPLDDGDVLAMASTPAYDPNRFSEGITHAYWKELNADPRNRPAAREWLFLGYDAARIASPW